MSDLSCAGCGAAQPAGTPFCSQCGRPSAGAAGAVAVPGGDPGSAAAPGHLPVHTGTTEPEVVGETRIPPAPPTALSAAVPTAPAGPRYAHVGRRVVAYLLDGAVAGALAGFVYGIGFLTVDVPTGVAAPDDPRVAAMVRHLVVAGVLAAVLALAYWVAIILWEGRTGKTLGNLALGIRTAGADDGRPLGFGRALVRHLLLAVSGVVPVVGPVVVLLSPLWDAAGRSQGWHDKAASAVVLDALDAGAVVAPAPAQPSARPAPAPPAPAQPAPPAPAPPADVPDRTAAVPVPGDPLITGVPGTAPAPAEPAPPQAAPQPAPATPAPPSEVSELTSFETRMQPSQRQVLRPAPVVGVVLELESGAREPVDGLARIGRNPEATPGEDVRLVRVDDPSRSMSKNHADLGVDTAGLWLTDRGSTNGTVISVTGLPPRVAEPGARVRVPVGATVHLGDRRVVVHPGATA